MQTQTIQIFTKKILENIKKDSFVGGYEATDEEAMGMLISKYFEWDGLSIMEAAGNALEDANFHTEAAVIRDLLDKIK